jgi:hypothetical protein
VSDDLSGGVCNEVVTEDEMTRALEAGSTGTSSGAVAGTVSTATGTREILNFQLRSFVESNKLTR